jgi:nitroimidazol reductase NimA-like FMN-containing flavoprotein (pyridoxamine 5'-phosphate oxidase superfamily)
MVVMDGRTWLEYMNPSVCWNLLSQAQMGRIGVIVDSAPEIYPVNFVVDEQSIVFRTDGGSKLRGLDRSPSVCFEVDHIEADQRQGWSILVKGRAAELVTADELSKVTSLPLEPWALGPKSRWIRIKPEEVTGRRIHPG